LVAALAVTLLFGERTLAFYASEPDAVKLSPPPSPKEALDMAIAAIPKA
jgi:hypothetical protein